MVSENIATRYFILVQFPDKVYEYNDLESIEELSILLLDLARASDIVPNGTCLIKLKKLRIG